MSYELKISPKDRAASRLVHSIHKQLVLAALETGTGQQEIAEKLGVNRSVVNRLLRGTANLTIRTLGEVAWALGLEVVVTLRRRRISEANPGERLVRGRNRALCSRGVHERRRQT